MEKWSAVLGAWVSKAREEGHDSLGAYEWPLGAAIIVGYGLVEWLSTRPTLGGVLFLVLVALAVWEGSRIEREQLHALGRRRFRGTLALRLTWVLVAEGLLLAYLLLGLAHARGWHWLEGWHDGPIVLTLVLGVYHLALGLKTRVARWVWLGAVLCGFAVLLPAVPPLRLRLHFVSGLLVGAALLVSGLLGRLDFVRRLRASKSV